MSETGDSLPPDPGRIFALAADDVGKESVEAPESLAGYRLLGLLGRGGMARVYRAVDASGRQVALKVIREARNAARLLREGRLAAQLRHPGILPVHATGSEDGHVFLVYPLVEGSRTLEDVLPNAPRAQGLSALAEVADALAHAHAQGVVHRDVKPENVLVAPDGRLLVADFGVGLAEGLDRLTQTGGVVGTPLYMAPEQLLGKREEQGAPSDVWSLGIMLFQLLSDGEFPHPGPTFMLLIGQIEAGPPALNSIPADLQTLCARALEKDPSARPTAVEFRDALRSHLAGTTSGSGGRPPFAWRNGRPSVALGALVAVALLLTLAAWAYVLTEPVVVPARTARPDPPVSSSTPTPPPPLARPSASVLRALALAGEFAAREDMDGAEAQYRFALSELTPGSPDYRATAALLAGVYLHRLSQGVVRANDLDMTLVERVMRLRPHLTQDVRDANAREFASWARLKGVISDADGLRLLGFARTLASDPLPIDLELARRHLEQGRTQRAASAVDSLLAEDPVPPTAQALRGALRLLKGDVREARSAVDEALRRAPEDFVGLRTLALICEQTGEVAQAIAAADRALAVEPGEIETLLLRSRLRLRAGDADGALRDAKSAVDIKASAASWRATALAYSGNGEHWNSAHAWKRVAGYSPEEADPWLRRAQALVKAKAPSDALEVLTEGLKLFPRDPSLALERIMILQGRGEDVLARTELNALVRRDGSYLPALFYLAERSVSWDQGWHNPNNTLVATSAILAREPNAIRALILRANARAELKRWEASRADAQAASHLDPQNGDAAALLGKALVELGRTEAGLVELDRAVRLSPDNIFRRHDRGAARRRLGLHAEAVEDFRQFVAVDGRNFWVLFKLGDSLSHTGAFAEAEAFFAQALDVSQGLDRWHPYYHRGLSREREGKFEAAISDFKAALSCTTDAERKALCRQALARIE